MVFIIALGCWRSWKHLWTGLDGSPVDLQPLQHLWRWTWVFFPWCRYADGIRPNLPRMTLIRSSRLSLSAVFHFNRCLCGMMHSDAFTNTSSSWGHLMPECAVRAYPGAIACPGQFILDGKDHWSAKQIIFGCVWLPSLLWLTRGKDLRLQIVFAIS